MKTRFHEKYTHKLTVPILLVVGSSILNLEIYWYPILILLLIIHIALNHKLIEVGTTKIYFRRNLNPFVDDLFIEVKSIEKVVYVDLSRATRGAFATSYLRLFTKNAEYTTYPIALSDHSVVELFQTFHKLNIPSESSTVDLDRDKPRKIRYK